MLTFSTFSNKKDLGCAFFLVVLYVTAFRKIRMVHHARARTFVLRFLGLIPLIGYKNDPLGTTYNFELKFAPIPGN